MADEVKRRPLRVTETVREPVKEIRQPEPEQVAEPRPRPIDDPPDWYVIALGQADRVFGEYVYRQISQLSNSQDWTDVALGRFQANTAMGIELRDKVVNKLQGLVAFEALSVEGTNAVQRVQPEVGKLSSGRGDEVPANTRVRSLDREF